MNGLDITSEPMTRLIVFIVFFLLLAVLELLSPRRVLALSKTRRWLNNIGISCINTALVAIVIPVAGVAAALFAAENGWGLFHSFGLAAWFCIPLYILAFDFTIYWQHRLFHRFNLLWRLHRVHHTDLDYDVTTGIRFHPLSILISSVVKLCLIAALGPPVAAVLISEVLLNTTSMFNHSNLKIPLELDKVLRLFLVTPDMHRVHHSVNRSEHNCNFGFNFPWWDRIFSSYHAQPERGHEDMQIGIAGFDESQSVGIASLLGQPFSDLEATESQG